MMLGSGDLIVEPETVKEGKDVQLKYRGKGPLYYSVDGAPWKKIPIDPKTGKGRVLAPIGSKYIIISDKRYPSPTNATIDVIGRQP